MKKLTKGSTTQYQLSAYNFKDIPINNRDILSYLDVGTKVLRQGNLNFVERHFDNVDISMFSDITSGNEGLMKIIYAVLNTIIHFVNNLKTMLFKFRKDIKRSELLYFHESHVLTIKKLFTLQYSSIEDLEIVRPAKMVVQYLPATQLSLLTLRSLNLLNRSSSFVSTVKQIRDSMLEDGTFDYSVTKMDDLRDTKTKYIALEKAMSGKGRDSLVFKDLFSDMNDFKEVNNLLLEAETYYNETSKIFENMNVCTGYFDDILQHLKKEDVKLVPKSIYELHKLTAILAAIFDMFGRTLENVSMIEHNFVETLKIVHTKL